MGLPKRLVLLRHGESQRNCAEGASRFWSKAPARIQDREIPDQLIDLTDKGWDQSLKTGLALAHRYGTFDVVYNSGYLRATRTREALLKAYTQQELQHIQLCHSHLVRERDPGYLYDMTENEAANMFPWFQEYWGIFGPFYARPPGGESMADVCQRVALFLTELNQKWTEKSVLVVTHDHSIHAFLLHLENRECTRGIANLHIDNCSITVFEPNHSQNHLILQVRNKVLYKKETKP